MFPSLFSEAIDGAIRALRQHPRIRLWTLIISSVLLPAFLITTKLSRLLIYDQVYLVLEGLYPFVVITLAVLILLCLASFTSTYTSIEETKQELDSLRSEREQIQQRISEGQDKDILNTVHLTLNQLNEYYTINKSQARNSFRFSVTAIVIGLITIVVGVWIFYLDDTPSNELTIISSISGVLLQFIGGAYFYLYKKSLDQLNYFFEQLTKMQDTMLSIRMIDEIGEESKANDLREKIILRLLERSTTSVTVPVHS